MHDYDGNSFLDIPAREGKPRERGLTHVMDKGLNLREIEGLFDTAGEYVDIVKLGWGTSYVTNNLEKKIALYRSFSTPVVCGGTLFEAVYGKDKMDDFKRWLEHYRFSHVEISDGTLDIPREQKLELIADFARDFVVLSEVGSKDSEVNIAPYLWVQWMREELDAGAWKVIAEGREAGTAGIYRPTGELRTGLVDEIEHSISFHDLIWETPTKSSQAWFVRHFGPEVNLGNIPPDEVIALETLRLGLRADTLKEVLLGSQPLPSQPPRLPDLDFEAMTAEEVIAWAHQFFWPRVCLTCSWQKQSSVLVHMVAELGLRMDTVELDTHLFFRESYETRDQLVERYQLKLIQPEIPTIAEQHRAEGPNLWERDPDRCCHIRKVEPLVNALAALRRMDLRDPPRPVAEPRRDPEGAVVGALPGLQDPSARRLGRAADLVVHQRQRHPLQPAPRCGLPFDRLHPLHAADAPRRGGARRPLGRLRQAGVRHPRKREHSKRTA